MLVSAVTSEVRNASIQSSLSRLCSSLCNLHSGEEAERTTLSQWLYSALAEAGLPVICVETRHMRAVLKAQINKTDRNDARGMAGSCCF